MAYKMTYRMQPRLLPSVVDDYVGPDDPVRVYDAFVNALDFQSLGIPLVCEQGGADEYYPRDMLKLIVYGYSYGIRSSRKLERACHHNLSFIWLMGSSTPDYRTIARFRIRYVEAIKKALRQCVRMCLKLNLIEGNTLFVDGSGFRANASIKHSWDQRRCQEYLAKIDTRIDQLLKDAQQIDDDESGSPSLVKIKEELYKDNKLKEKIKEIIASLDAKAQAMTDEQLTRPEVSQNTVDADCVKMNTRQGKHAAYNVQMVTDSKHGFIVHCESSVQNTDYNQLHRQVTQAAGILEKTPECVCSDSGYYSITDLQKIDSAVTVVIPDRQQAHKDKTNKEITPFDKSRFRYDTSNDRYICPEGMPLEFMGYDAPNQGRAYRAKGTVCQQCRNFGRCTTSDAGRKVNRSDYQPLKDRLKAIYDSPQSQEIYALRKQKAELPFGHIKRNLSAGQFLLRGKKGTDVELSVLSICFNMARMITIIGIPGLLVKLKQFIT